MTILYNKVLLKNIRRKLRKQNVLAEKILWSRLRNKQQGFRFRRQYSIGNYIVDFYIPEIKLAIEIDGATHSSKEEKRADEKKKNFIEKFEVKLIRYTNIDIFENLDAVLEDILDKGKRI